VTKAAFGTRGTVIAAGHFFLAVDFWPCMLPLHPVQRNANVHFQNIFGRSPAKGKPMLPKSVPSWSHPPPTSKARLSSKKTDHQPPTVVPGGDLAKVMLANFMRVISDDGANRETFKKGHAGKCSRHDKNYVKHRVALYWSWEVPVKCKVLP
jgi:hypothetical protein